MTTKPPTTDQSKPGNNAGSEAVVSKPSTDVPKSDVAHAEAVQELSSRPAQPGTPGTGTGDGVIPAGQVQSADGTGDAAAGDDPDDPKEESLYGNLMNFLGKQDYAQIAKAAARGGVLGATFATAETLLAGFESGNPDNPNPSNPESPDSEATEVAKAKDQAETAATTGGGAWNSFKATMSDFGSAALGVVKAVVPDVIEDAAVGAYNYLSGSGWSWDDWGYEDQSDANSTAVTGEQDFLANLNNDTPWRVNSDTRSMQKFAEATNLEGAATIEMPSDAKPVGTVRLGQQEVTLKKSGNDTYMVDKDGKVIAKDKGDGNYEIKLKDESKLNVKLEPGADGKPELKSLERVNADGKVTQRVENGVLYNYNYDRTGKLASIDAAVDFQGNLSQQELDKRKDDIIKKLGPNGQVTIRYSDENGQDRRLHVQTLDQDTRIETDLDQGTARIFHQGQEYRLNKQDELGRVENGEWKALSAEERHQLSDRIEQLKRDAWDARRRARDGGRVRDVDIHFRERCEDGRRPAEIERREPPQADGTPGPVISAYDVPIGNDKPMVITRPQTGETDTIQGENISVKDGQDKNIWQTTPDGFETGADGEGFKIDENGLLHKPTGALLKPDGSFIGTDPLSEVDYWGYGDDCEHSDAQEAAEQAKVSAATGIGSVALNLGMWALSVAKSGYLSDGMHSTLQGILGSQRAKVAGAMAMVAGLDHCVEGAMSMVRLSNTYGMLQISQGENDTSEVMSQKAYDNGASGFALHTASSNRSVDRDSVLTLMNGGSPQITQARIYQFPSSDRQDIV